MSECIKNGYGSWVILYELERRTNDRRKQYHFKNIDTGEIKTTTIRQLKKLHPMPEKRVEYPVKKHPLYRTYVAIKTRCYNKNTDAYYWYGAKGVIMCDRWFNSFWDFVKDVGERPLGKTLDRIDSSGNYEPNNCKWSTAKEQANNRKPNSGWRKKHGQAHSEATS